MAQAIDFAKEQNDDDLWEDLLRYSETKPGKLCALQPLSHANFIAELTLRYLSRSPSFPLVSAFIRGLLENVGAEIDPIRLIRRIKDGLEIPGLKDALIKILHDFNLQVSRIRHAGARQAIAEAFAKSISDFYEIYRLSLASALPRRSLYWKAAQLSCITIIRPCRSTCIGDRPTANTATVSARIFFPFASHSHTVLLILSSFPMHFPSLATILGETLCASCQKPLFTVASDTYNAVRAPLSVLFLCRHAFHLTCLLPTNSIPASRERPLPPILRTSSASVPSAGGGENGVSAVTVVGAGMSTAPFGPARRADEARRALKDKIEYQTALDKLLRKGCPRCKVDAQRWVAEFVR